ncbi:cyclic nucleotide-gated ion channel [Stappia sp. ES.058]|uniref:cyclic nucleotide-gated ion channel n=1 Tax=Stappia sp. ES.058 TaxID=1881061 RepID=UPI0008796EB3|nr:cyclic nucleotide-gated ion channel [Stappia sp. ES.058]SDU23824.1 voltage-gated potassium channel [Stappia sp. ES.058]
MDADREEPDEKPVSERRRHGETERAAETDPAAERAGDAGASPAPPGRSFKQRVFRLLELGSSGDPQGQWVDRILLVFIVLTVVLVVLETVPSVQREWSGALNTFEFVVGTVFLAEYLLRLWVADLHPPFRRLKPLQARLRYAVRGEALIDLLAVLPFFIGFLLPTGDFKALIVLRLLRFFKVARYSPALRSLANAVAGERHALGASLVIIFGVMLLAATGMYLVERTVQPDKLGTIPHAMWWALATLTTVGYGDVVPITAAGKILGGLVMLMGYGLFALPIGIIATAFAREIHARDFVVTWGMVASVPLFEDLRASEIAEISKLLRALSVDGGQPITREGEEATSMYFIARGAVVVELGTTRARLEEGAFFGEMAILGGRRRLASVNAAEATQLMVLEANDLQRLMTDKPEIARKILDEVKERSRFMTSSGDIVPEELTAAGSDDFGSDDEGDHPPVRGPDLFTSEDAAADRAAARDAPEADGPDDDGTRQRDRDD